MNKIFLKGRLTNNPEQKFIRDEISVTRFNIAIDRRVKKDEEKQTDFINIVAWNKLGEFVKNYFDKGQEILIIGRLETNQYIDKDSQKKITSYNVVAEEIEFCGSKKEKKEDDLEIPEKTTLYHYEEDDELPF